MKKPIRISCLPVAGIANPYQHLMMQGLSADGRCIARNGYKDRLTGIIRTAIGKPSAYMHFDWIDGLYSRRSTILMYINIALFITQIWMVKHLFRTKIVCTIHNLHPHDHVHKIHHQVHAWFYKQCNWVRVFSDSTIASVSSSYHIPVNKFKVVPVGSYKGYYPDTITSTAAKTKLGVSQFRRVYLSFGNIRPYKGLEQFIRIFNTHARKDELFIIAGRAPYVDYLNQLKSIAGPNILFKADFISPEEVQIYYRAADIVVAPFHAIENSGSVLLAMDFSKPVLAPASGVLPFYLRNQPELVYPSGGLEAGFIRAQQLSDSDINKIGQNNALVSGSYSFEQFTAAFITT